MFDRNSTTPHGNPQAVIGIDPGVSRCGYGVVAHDTQDLILISAGVIRTQPTCALPDRLATLERELTALVHETNPVAMAVERVLFQNNARTAMSVGQASGIAMVVASRAGIPVTHYSPNEVKLAVTGYGAAGKAQVQAMVQRLLGLAEPPNPPDVADALALAICHIWSKGGIEISSASPPGTGFERAVAAAISRELSNS